MTVNPGEGNRRDIMFLQSQWIPWEDHTPRGPGAHRRRLSQSPLNGSETLLLRFEPGYSAEPGFLSADFEYLVIEGSVEINRVPCAAGTYGMHPAGFPHRTLVSATGAVLLVITSGGPDELHRGTPRFAVRKERLVVSLNTLALPWYNGVDPRVQAAHLPPPPLPLSSQREPEPTVFTKILWEDPDTKGHTFLRSDLPRLPRGPQTVRTHIVDAEYFLFAGDYIIAGEGRMTPGAYFFWAANAMHGPSACEHISYLIGKYYGPVALINGEERRPITLDPIHQPRVPVDLAAYANPVPMPDPWN